MGKKGEGNPAAPRIEKPPEQAETLVAAGADADAAAELAAYVEGDLFASLGLGIVNDFATGLQLGAQRNDQVVHNRTGRDGIPETLAHRIDCPVGP